MVLGDLDKLILRLEHTHKQLAGGTCEEDDQWGGDQLGRAMAACIRQVDHVREAIQSRESFARQGDQGLRTPDGIAASSTVRRELNELGLCAERVRKTHEQKRKGKRGGQGASQVSWEDKEVDELLRLVNACVESEKRGITRGGGSGSSSTHSSPNKSPKKPVWTPVTTLEGGQAKGKKSKRGWLGGSSSVAHEGAAVGAGDLRESLLEISARDEAMEVGLDAIASGLERLKSLATDVSGEVAVQSVMLDEIASRAQGAEDELENINQRLEKTLRQAGGASRVLVNMVLLLLLFSLVMFIYTTIKEASPLVR